MSIAFADTVIYTDVYAPYQRLARQLESVGVTFGHYVALKFLDEAAGALTMGAAAGTLTMGALAARCGNSKPTMARMVDLLVGAGRVTREFDADDRRLVAIRITATGRLAIGDAERALSTIEEPRSTVVQMAVTRW